MSAVFKRELRSYFNSMTGWIFLAVIFVFTGVFTTAINLLSQSASFEYVLSQITIVFMLIVPILAMRSIAEERRSRTDQLLYSLPLRAVDIVLGKYLSMVAVLFISCVAMGFVPVLLSLYGIVRYASCYAALLGFFLLGAALTFYTVQGLEVVNILTDGGREISQYPMDIYRRGFRIFFTGLIPYACTFYWPLLYLTGRTGSALCAAAPLAGFLFLLPCTAVFRLASRRYRSTGS